MVLIRGRRFNKVGAYSSKYGMLSMGDSSGVQGLRNELLAPSVLILEEVQIPISLLSRKTCD